MRALHPPHRMGCNDKAWRGVDCLLVIGSFADTQKKINRQGPHVFVLYNHHVAVERGHRDTQNNLSRL